MTPNMARDGTLLIYQLFKIKCVTCISGSIPFPNIAAMIEMEVKALKAWALFLGSKE